MITPEVLQKYFQYWKKDFWAGGILAEIQTYSRAKQTAKVQPLYKTKVKNKFVKLPILVDVPICNFSAGDIDIYFDYKKGDIVQLNINVAQTENSTRGFVDSLNDNRYAIENAVIISGIKKRPFTINSNIPSDGLVIAEKNGDYIQFKKDKIKMKTKKLIIDGDVEIEGELIVSDEVTAGVTQTKLTKHGHTTVLGPTILPIIPLLG